MSYHSKSISEIVDDIEFERAFLPAIQRKFVWPRHIFEYHIQHHSRQLNIYLIR